ncbi:immunity 51 family protein [Corynebacterium sp. p3-SID1241]|uniref:immunity 51 family protein n=1 Tax=Corynebacterium sp. p3-SID1241 TaxID=2916102 RepID=UPI0021A61159|nr:immunity 51 family protein [Corynebacterium sp. p3-SID1241]MCT1428840.1 immunity 51 family protein [Corynebacterium sp. p3-SID1241]
MALKLVFDSPKGSRPKAGQLYLMKTTLGYIPVGVVSTEAFFGAAAMIHPYRAIVSDIKDTTWYPLIEKNELLIPPLQIIKSDFRKGGDFYSVKDKNAPHPVPFDRYFNYRSSFPWSPEEQAFVPTSEALPTDKLGTFIPKHERHIEYTLHDTNPPQGGIVDEAPEGAFFMPAGLHIDLHIEFALEDALCHHGLIDTPRPAHPDFSDDQEQGQDTMTAESPQENQPPFHLAEIDGMTSLFAAQDAIPEEVVRVVGKAGHTPNGYFLENLAKQLLLESNISTDDIEFDSEAGMFSLIGTAAALLPLHDQLTDLFSDTNKLQQTLKRAQAAGTDFDD